jgi:transcriptional regulator with XRE-family HTH domain
MNGTFHQVLSQLRKNKGVSQRKVASDLYISQALLSHYENGIREPGLDFVNRACDYYGVTADFLLGRTESSAAALPAADAGKFLLDARTLVTFLQTVDQWESDSLSEGVRRCFAAVIYRLLRHLDIQATDRALLFMSVPKAHVAPLSDMEFSSGEMQFLNSLTGLPDSGALPQQLGALLAALDTQISSHSQGKE